MKTKLSDKEFCALTSNEKQSLLRLERMIHISELDEIISKLKKIAKKLRRDS